MQESAAPLPPTLVQPPATPAAVSSASWKGMLIGAVVGGAVSYGGFRLMQAGGLPTGSLGLTALHELGGVALLLASIGLLWLAILAHEFGHLTAGRLAGLRPALLFAGPLRLDFGGGLPHLSLNRQGSTWGGLAVALPGPQGMQRGASMALVAGGPAASWLLALLAVGVGAVTTGIPAALASLLALLSAGIGIVTLIPLHAGGYASDGGQLLQQWRRAPEAAQRAALTMVMGQSLAGQRPREWDRDLLCQVAAEADLPVLRISAMLLLAQAEDDTQGGRTVDAQSPAFQAYAAVAAELHTDRLAQFPKAFRAGLLLPIATFLAQCLHQSASARAWLNAAGEGVVEPIQRLHAQAAVALAEGDHATARQRAEEALALPPRGMDPGGQILARERLQLILAKA